MDDVGAHDGPAYWSDPATVAAWRSPVEPWQSPIVTMEAPMFWRLAGDVRGARVLDLGCGDGSLGAELFVRGASRYHGIDPSRALLAHAVPSERATFACGTVEEFNVGDERFDLIVARLVLHYVADLDAAIARIVTALTATGALVYTIEHPIITSHESDLSRDKDGFRTRWVVDDYFAAGPRHVAWFNGTVTKHHRPLEDHVGVLAANGLRVVALYEARPDEALFSGHHDEYVRRSRIPLFLGIRATRLRA